jgi:hypothetical protein
VTLDPEEGLDPDGYLVTGVDRSRVPAAYEPALADAVTTLTGALGDLLHGLYLYGSVATGQAVPPASDVDLLAVSTAPIDPSVLSGLSARHAGTTREVALAVMTPEQLHGDDDEGLGNRAFLKHYCVLLAGADARPDLPRYRPSRALVDGFAGDLTGAVEQWRSTSDGRRAARRLLLFAATSESLAHGGWTTDRATGAALVRRHHPEWTSEVDRALRWSAGAAADPGEVSRFLDGFARWLLASHRGADQDRSRV